MSLHERWTYGETDPAIMLFTAALQAWQLPILPGQSVLELGCNETDFLKRLHQADPSLQLTGVDARPHDREPDGYTFVQGNAFDVSLFPPASFDWVLMLGALEHFGLGYYGDPQDDDGDLKTVDAAAEWLKPGGCLYFDVPCNPGRSQTRHFRTYSPLGARQLTAGYIEELARGYSLPEPHAGTWIPQPVIHRVPYHFVAVWARKD